MSDNWRSRLRMAVDRTGKKHAAIARDAGVTPETLSRVLTGAGGKPAFDTIVRIAHAAGESVGYILHEHDFPYSVEERAALTDAAAIILHREGWSIIKP